MYCNRSKLNIHEVKSTYQPPIAYTMISAENIYPITVATKIKQPVVCTAERKKTLATADSRPHSLSIWGFSESSKKQPSAGGSTVTGFDGEMYTDGIQHFEQCESPPGVTRNTTVRCISAPTDKRNCTE